MGFVEDMVVRLMAGDGGEKIVQEIVQKYSTPCARASKISLVKRKALDSNMKHPRHDVTLLQFTRLFNSLSGLPQKCHTHFQEFMSAPLHAKVRLHQKHQKRAFCFENEQVDTAFRNLELLHPELQKLRPPETVTDACDRANYKRKMKKSESMFVLADGLALLKKLIAHLQLSEQVPFTRSGTLIALLGTSGRRATEVVSPHSVFEPTDHPYVVRFTGQLKKLGDPNSYNVPLLVPSAKWLDALARYRAKQPARAQTMTAQQLERSFGSAPREYLAKHLPEAGHIHNLRGIYASMVCVGYDTGLFNDKRVIYQIMGHERMGETQDHYDGIRLRGFESMRHRYGPFSKVASAVLVNDASA
jgi:hypothetical protein